MGRIVADIDRGCQPDLLGKTGNAEFPYAEFFAGVAARIGAKPPHPAFGHPLPQGEGMTLLLGSKRSSSGVRGDVLFTEGMGLICSLSLRKKVPRRGG